jgi:hypothetical protein
MRLIATCSVFVAFSSAINAQTALSESKEPPPCIVEDLDTPAMPKCVIESRHGVMFVPRHYWMHPAFNQYDLAPFTIQSFGRVYVNRAGRVVIRDVAFMDNAPDEFHHGLVRIERDGKWGYASPTGRIVVPLEYSCALNYKDQHSDVGPLLCVGCRATRQGDHDACSGGKWYRINTKGQLTSTGAQP